MKLKYLILFLTLNVSINSQIIRETISPLATPIYSTQEKISDKFLDYIDSPNSIESYVKEITVQLSDNVLVPFPIMGNDEGDVYEINSSFTQEYLSGRKLFGTGSRLDAALFYTNSTDRTAFYLDPDWKRILYSREANGQYSEIKEFTGVSPIIFENPVAIDVNEYREVYIADSQGKKIYKLNYNTNNTITASSSSIFINSQYLDKPTDVDYSNNETPNDRTDDYIVVCDAGRRSILIFNTNGTLQYEFFGYTRPDGYIPFNHPTRITTYGHYKQFVVIDDGSKHIINCIVYPSYLLSAKDLKLPLNSNPVDIGLDGTDNFVVVDKGLQMLHYLNEWGDYICSYKGPSTNFFINPETITNFAFSAFPGYIKLELFNMDSWSSSRGIKKFVPGADVLNLVDMENSLGHYIHPIFTNYQYNQIKIKDFTTNNIIYDSGIFTSIPGVYHDFYNSQLIPEHTYKWIVSYKPYYDSYYGNYAVGWKSKEALIPTMVRPIISSITQNPVPIYKGTSGYVYCNLSQGNGTINYNWFSTNQPSYITINPNGSSCRMTYLNTESIPSDAPTWDFGCTVTNPAFPGWSSTMRFSPSLNSDPNGCPTLAFEQNGNLVSENPLLISSVNNPGIDVIDYYLINAPLVPINNKVNLTIHEPQTEHTWFDNVSLWETRANEDEKIVVNDEGRVINYKGILPIQILLNGETDITQNLSEMDSLTVNLTAGDKLTILRNTTEGDGDVVLGGEEPPPAQKKIASMLMSSITTKNLDKDDGEVITEIVPIANFFLRPNKSIISKRLRNLPAGTLEITINKDLKLDYFVFVSDLRTVRVRELPLLSAIHILNGDVKSKLFGIDENYAEIYPTEKIDLSFNTTLNTGNRAYILKTVGRYETDSVYITKQNSLAKLNNLPIIPTENKLYNNYPNPFNPTTLIKYNTKENSKVELKVFDVLGREIAALVNEEKPAGYHEVEFNASSLASGIYFYRIQAGSFVDTKKMILMK